MAAASRSASTREGETLIDTTVAVSTATFARLARSQDYYRSTRVETGLTNQEVLELGDWVPWEFQSEDQAAPSNSENCDEVVPSPPPCIEAKTTTTPSEGAVKEDESNPVGTPSETRKNTPSEPQDSEGTAGKVSERRPQQMYRKIRLRTAVTSPLGSTHNDGVQGQTLREGENEVIYTETDCVTGLPMFRGDMAVKTTYRVARDESDPDNSVRVKVSVVVRDVKLARAMGWLSKVVRKSIKDSAKKQAALYLNKMVEAKATLGTL